MPTFDEIVSISSIYPPEDLDLSLIDNLDITEITSNTLQDYFADLYDNKGVRGAPFSECKAFIIRVLEYAKRSGYIEEVPQIKLRSKKPVNRFNKPSTEIIEHILIHSKGLPVETIVRLAWDCGLSRAEIPTLKYDQIDFKNGKIVLPDRKVPIPSCTLQFLEKLKSKNQVYSDYVLISQKKEAPMAEQSVSNIVRCEFDKYGQKVRLSDLRTDFIVDCLKNNSIEYVSYISGVNIRTLQTRYLLYLEEATGAETDKVKTINYNSIYQYMISEKDSITGLTLWFFWQLGMTVKELPQLTWDMVDFDNAKINSVFIPDKLLILLRDLRAKNEQYSNRIFLTENTKKPMDEHYIKKLVKEKFVKKGYIDFGFTKLRKEYSPLKKMLVDCLTKNRYVDSGLITKELNITEKEAQKLLQKLKGEIVLVGTKYYLQGTVVSPENQERLYLKNKLIDYLKKYRYIDSETITKEFGITGREAWKFLKKLRESGDIILIGTKYYLHGTVISPENQEAAILDYVKEHPYSTRKELSDLLGLADRRQLLPIVRPLIEQGKLIRTEGRKYCLPQDE